MKAVHVLGGQGAFSSQLRVELSGPENVDSTSRKGASDGRPVSFNKAERPLHDSSIPHHAAHDVYLTDHAVDQFGAVTTSDNEPLDTWAEQASIHLKAGPPAVTLSVDHVDPTASDNEVIDIRATPRNSTVMKDTQHT